jgi:arginine utilization protein RocB
VFWNMTKIFESLATITANTANHKEDLQEFKDNFDKHIDKEEKETISTNKKIDQIHCKLTNFECPHDERLLTLEEKYLKMQKDKGKELIAEAEKKAVDIKERALVDQGIAKEISSLKTSKKYQWLTSSGIYIVLVVILKKIFTTS